MSVPADELDRYVGKCFTLWLIDDKKESVAYGGWRAERWQHSLRLVRPGGQLELEPSWLERIRPVLNEESREILLGADYFLPLTVGFLPEHTEGGIPTGMRWPD